MMQAGGQVSLKRRGQVQLKEEESPGRCKRGGSDRRGENAAEMWRSRHVCERGGQAIHVGGKMRTGERERQTREGRGVGREKWQANREGAR